MRRCLIYALFFTGGWLCTMAAYLVSTEEGRRWLRHVDDYSRGIGSRIGRR